MEFEFEDLSDEEQREARRMGLAFGVETWMNKVVSYPERKEYVHLHGHTERLTAFLCLRRADARLDFFRIGGYQGDSDYCELGWWEDNISYCEFPPEYSELMARAVYQLGIENYESEEELPALTMHEKLELRLSLPREFWPKTWLQEMEDGT